MRVKYDKLWNYLEMSQMTKEELRQETGIGNSTMSKLTKDSIVSMRVMMKICEKLHCDIGDVMEFVE